MDDYSVQDLPQVQGGQMNTTDPNTGMFNQNPHQALGGFSGALVALNNQMQGAKLSDQMMAQRQLIAHMQSMKLQEAQRQQDAEALQRQYIQDHPEASWEDIYKNGLGQGASGSDKAVAPMLQKMMAGQNSAANAAERNRGALDREHYKGGGTDSTGAVSAKALSQIDATDARAANYESMTQARDDIQQYKISESEAKVKLDQARTMLANATAGLAGARAGAIPQQLAQGWARANTGIISVIEQAKSKAEAIVIPSEREAALADVAALEAKLGGVDAIVKRGSLQQPGVKAPEAAQYTRTGTNAQGQRVGQLPDGSIEVIPGQ